MRIASFFSFRIIILGLFISCQNEENKEIIIDELANKDVPKFISLLPTLSHDNIRVAFQQANSVLKYKLRKPSSSYFSLEACSQPNQGKNWVDGQITLYALSIDSSNNEFAIALSFYPPLKDSLLYYNVKKLLNNYIKIDGNGGSEWRTNDWVIRIKALNEISCSPIPRGNK